MSLSFNTILSSCYFPPIPWFALAMRAENIIIDIHENYIKQTWRNRCSIITANGPMDLIIPIRHTGNHTPMKDVIVDYSTNWQRVHSHAIRSAYGKSPYYEYYGELFDRMFACQPKYLIEWNEIGVELIENALKLSFTYSLSEEYVKPDPTLRDYRSLIVPGTESGLPPHPKYIQVFEERHGFRHGLSIIDLLCCEGPDTTTILNAAT